MKLLTALNLIAEIKNSGRIDTIQASILMEELIAEIIKSKYETN